MHIQTYICTLLNADINSYKTSTFEMILFLYSIRSTMYIYKIDYIFLSRVGKIQIKNVSEKKERKEIYETYII